MLLFFLIHFFYLMFCIHNLFTLPTTTLLVLLTTTLLVYTFAILFQRKYTYTTIISFLSLTSHNNNLLLLFFIIFHSLFCITLKHFLLFFALINTIYTYIHSFHLRTQLNTIPIYEHITSLAASQHTTHLLVQLPLLSPSTRICLVCFLQILKTPTIDDSLIFKLHPLLINIHRTMITIFPSILYHHIEL